VVGVTATVISDGTTLGIGNRAKVRHKFLDGLVLEIRSTDRIVHFGDVCVVMFPVVDFHGASIDVRLQRIARVR
jgi:hypothetical protein